MRADRAWAWCSLVAIVPMLVGRAETVTLRPVADTTLFETAPTNNLGREPTLVVGTTNNGRRNRALVRFDVAGKVPAGAVVTVAQLTLNVIKESGISAKNSTFELRPLLVSWAAIVLPDGGGSVAGGTLGDRLFGIWSEGQLTVGHFEPAVWLKPGRIPKGLYHRSPGLRDSATLGLFIAGGLAYTSAPPHGLRHCIRSMLL